MVWQVRPTDALAGRFGVGNSGLRPRRNSPSWQGGRRSAHTGPRAARPSVEERHVVQDEHPCLRHGARAVRSVRPSTSSRQRGAAPSTNGCSMCCWCRRARQSLDRLLRRLHRCGWSRATHARTLGPVIADVSCLIAGRLELAGRFRNSTPPENGPNQSFKYSRIDSR